MNSMKLFFDMLRIGCIGFGGGSALIPIVQKMVVDEQQAITQEEYEEDVVVSSITPGALTVKLAGAVGRRVSGGYGMLVGAMGMALPGVLMTIVLLSVMSHLDAALVRQVNFVSVGIMAYIACLLTDYVIGTIKQADKNKKSYVGIIFLVFLLTCGKTGYRLFGLEGTPKFSMATIEIFGVAFLILCMAMLYKQCTRPVNVKYTMKWKQILPDKELWKQLGIVLILFLIVFVPACMVTKATGKYVGNAFLSALLSFGGGDAYLTVADGFFVSTGLVSEDVFYGSVVPIVNILPGSVLCKMLSGVGYCIGFEQTGSVFGGYLLATVGLFCSIAASCGVVAIVGHIYRAFGELEVFQLMKQWIRPIVSGLMLNVILSLVYQTRKVGITQEVEWLPVVVMCVIYIINMLLHYKYKMSNGKMVAISVGLSWLLCNVCTFM